MDHAANGNMHTANECMYKGYKDNKQQDKEKRSNQVLERFKDSEAT